MYQLEENKVMLSVVMPVYNRAGTVKDALDSLVKQSWSLFETIIVDDGSTDNTAEVVKRYNDILDIVYIKAKHTGNIAAVRNLGLSLAKGSYAAVLDSDDICIKSRFEKQVNYLEKNSDIDILASRTEFIGDSGFSRHEFLDWLYNTEMDKSEMIKRFLNDGCCLCHSTVMMRKRSLEALKGYDERYDICEDYSMWMEAITKKMNIAVLPEKLVIRRLHKLSVTNEYEGSDKAIEKIIKIKIDFLVANGIISGKNTAVLGINKRNELIRRCAEYNGLRLEYLGVHDSLDIEVLQKYNYFFVTTFSQKQKVFEFLQGHGKKIVKDFIYL